MKKILLTAFVLLLAAGVKAQVGGEPRQLTCTEEAFNFKVNIKSGWHLSQVSMGPSGLPKNTPDYIPVRSFNEPASKDQPYPFNLAALRATVNLRLPDSLILPNPGKLELDKLNYLPYSNNFRSISNYNSLKPDFRVN